MPLSEASLVQPPNQGTFDAASGTASLGSPTGGASTVLLIGYAPFEAGSLNLKTPDGFGQDFVIGSGSAQLASWRRPDCPAGESSWTIATPSSLPCLMFWFAYEFGGVDLSEPLERQVAAAIASGTSLSTGTTASTAADDVVCFAVHSANGLTTITGHTNGFTVNESAQQSSASHGNGTVTVCRQYPGAGGTFESTATLGVSSRGLAAMLVYRAVGALPVLPPEVMSSAGGVQ